MREFGEVLAAILQALAPVAVEMAHEAMKGGNPVDVLTRERVEKILPEHLQLDLAMKVERARRAGATP